MLNATELRAGIIFKEDGSIFEVLKYEHIKMGRGSANIKVKVRNLKTGATTEKSFISGSRVDEIEPIKRKVQYLYNDGSTYNFMDVSTFEQFSLNKDILGEKGKFLKENDNYVLLSLEDEPLDLELPRTVELKIAEAGPGVKGDTVSNVYKPATLENGITIQVPLFIKEGDLIKVDTKTGDYVERLAQR